MLMKEFLKADKLRHEYFCIDYVLKYGHSFAIETEFPYIRNASVEKLEARQAKLKKQIQSLDKRMQKKTGWRQSMYREDLSIRP